MGVEYGLMLETFTWFQCCPLQPQRRITLWLQFSGKNF